LKHTIVIIIVSTSGQGEFPQNARSFWKSLLSNRLKNSSLQRLVFSSFGLGDSSYPKYNVAHRLLYNRLIQLGAKPFCNRGEGNEQHQEGFSYGLRIWMKEISTSLDQFFPLPLEYNPIPNDQFIEPNWQLEIDDDKTPTLVDDRSILDPDSSLISIIGSEIFDIESNSRLTPDEHFQDVRLLTLSTKKEVDYGPGGIAVLYPKNFPADVQAFIDLQSWQDVADIPVQLVSIKDNITPSPVRHVSEKSFTIRQLLSNHLDILSIPRRSFFSSLSYFVGKDKEDDIYERDRLLELANPELIDELWDYTTRPRRTILEVMADFPRVKIPWRYACTVIPIIKGRQFSIASGGNQKKSSDGTMTRIELLIAIANPPNTIIKYRKRHGVCSRYIASLKKGQQISMTVQPGYFNMKPDVDFNKPMIMIAPGTGVAPMRNLIQERIQYHQHQSNLIDDYSLENCYLFFGCRDRKADFFFETEWDELQRHGLQVSVAPSREKNTPRIYVQDLIRTKADILFELIDKQDAIIFVCGSSGNMPKGVREALIDVIIKGQSCEYEIAEKYLDGLEKRGRYKQETW